MTERSQPGASPPIPSRIVKATGTQSSSLSLTLGQDLPFQFRMWRIERIGWAVMFVILLTASAGFFGHGPLSMVVIRNESLRVEYERFGRYHAATSLRFNLEPTVQKHDRITIWLSNQYLLNMRVVGTVPQPERMEVSSEGLRFVFSAGEGLSVGMIVFHLHPDTVGPIAGSFILNDSQQVFFSQFIYP
jgi:hypothetical protein